MASENRPAAQGRGGGDGVLGGCERAPPGGSAGPLLPNEHRTAVRAQASSRDRFHHTDLLPYDRLLIFAPLFSSRPGLLNLGRPERL